MTRKAERVGLVTFQEMAEEVIEAEAAHLEGPISSETQPEVQLIVDRVHAEAEPAGLKLARLDRGR